MALLGKLASVLGGSIIKDVGDVVDKFVTTDAEKLVIKNETARIVLAHVTEAETSIRAEMEAKSAVIVAEMQSGDPFTKRARPSVVYFGLAVIGINYVIGPWVGFFLTDPIIDAAGIAVSTVPNIELPEEFWYSWSGVVGLWVIGRSAERRGAQGRIIQAITGTVRND